MYIGRFLYQGQTHWGWVETDTVISLNSWCTSLAEGLAKGWDTLREQATKNRAARLPIQDIEWLVPVEAASKILCVGLNYGKHVAETQRNQAAWPSLFLRHIDSFVGHEQNAVKPDCSDQFDFEGELVVVIGREGRHISEADAMKYVAGYTCMAENSVRDFQKHTTQVTAGKNFDASGMIGPWIVDADTVGDPARLTLETRLNGKQVQYASVADLVFSIPRLISYISTFTTLRAGDLIATGTPEGIGFRRNPPLFMQAGDNLEVEISQLGTLRSKIIAET